MIKCKNKEFFFTLCLVIFGVNSGIALEETSNISLSTPIETITLDKILFFPTREAPATVISLNNSLISAEISGEITEILVQTGDEVKKGDVLAKLNCKAYEIAQHRARAALKSGLARTGYAKKKLVDAKRLRESKTISSDHLNQRSSEAIALSGTVGVLNADLDEASRLVFKCNIAAPIDAVVTTRIASVGDYATPGSPIVQLLDLMNMEVSAKIQQQDVESLQTASSLHFIVSGTHYPVTLRTVVPLINSRIRSFESRLTFIDGIAPSGSAGRLSWASNKAHIPSDLLVERDNKVGVFLYQGGHAKFHQLDNEGLGLPAIIQLPNETEIVSTGRYGLIDGQAVNVIR